MMVVLMVHMSDMMTDVLAQVSAALTDMVETKALIMKMTVIAMKIAENAFVIVTLMVMVTFAIAVMMIVIVTTILMTVMMMKRPSFSMLFLFFI